MSHEDRGAARALPPRPSKEHLRKQAKRLSKSQSLGLSEAQRRLAADYGFSSWAALMARVDEVRGGETGPQPSALSLAAEAGDLAEVRRLLAEGHPADGDPTDMKTPLWRVCASNAPAEIRLAIADTLLDAGAGWRTVNAGSTALHEAAERGPLALVERLIRAGALEWLEDDKGREPLDRARAGRAPDKAAIIDLLDRSLIRDPAFSAAVDAIHTGDVPALERLLDAHPNLLRDRAVGPAVWREAPRHQYFLEPKLFWFIADNPNLVPRLPDNIVEVAAAMIRRSVDKTDLDYALELVMTSGPANDQGLAPPLIEVLLAAGADPNDRAMDMALAHRMTGAVRAILKAGRPVNLSIAAGLGLTESLPALLAGASPEAKQTALLVGVMNDQLEAVRMVLDAGADPVAFCPIHAHGTPLHHAVQTDDPDLVRLLLERGADPGVRDTLWNGAAHGWAMHGPGGCPRARAVLEEWAGGRPMP